MPAVSDAFCPGRAWEQIRTNICLNDVDVKIAGAHAGVSVGHDGATHQAIEDIAIMRCIPRMRVVVPCDAAQTRKATEAVAQAPGLAANRPVPIEFVGVRGVFGQSGTPEELIEHYGMGVPHIREAVRRVLAHKHS